jgi:tetratricopeptide (TPR) repeat protein
MRTYTLFLATLPLVVTSCAYRRAMTRGDDAAAVSRWSDALEAYEKALDAKPTSTDAKTRSDQAREHALEAALADASHALDASDYETAMTRVKWVTTRDPANRDAALVIEDARERLTAEIRGDMAEQGTPTGIYELLVRANALFQDLPVVPETYQALRERLERDAAMLQDQHGYPEALDDVRLIARYEPDQDAHVQILEQAILTSWANDFTARAAAASLKKQDALAAALYARAYEIAGRIEDLDHSRDAAANVMGAS